MCSSKRICAVVKSNFCSGLLSCQQKQDFPCSKCSSNRSAKGLCSFKKSLKCRDDCASRTMRMFHFQRNLAIHYFLFLFVVIQQRRKWRNSCVALLQLKTSNLIVPDNATLSNISVLKWFNIWRLVQCTKVCTSHTCTAPETRASAALADWSTMEKAVIADTRIRRTLSWTYAKFSRLFFKAIILHKFAQMATFQNSYNSLQMKTRDVSRQSRCHIKGKIREENWEFNILVFVAYLCLFFHNPCNLLARQNWLGCLDTLPIA